MAPSDEPTGRRDVDWDVPGRKFAPLGVHARAERCALAGRAGMSGSRTWSSADMDAAGFGGEVRLVMRARDRSRREASERGRPGGVGTPSGTDRKTRERRIARGGGGRERAGARRRSVPRGRDGRCGVVGSAETAERRARRRGVVFQTAGGMARAHLLDALAITSVKRAPCATRRSR